MISWFSGTGPTLKPAKHVFRVPGQQIQVIPQQVASSGQARGLRNISRSLLGDSPEKHDVPLCFFRGNSLLGLPSFPKPHSIFHHSAGLPSFQNHQRPVLGAQPRRAEWLRVLPMRQTLRSALEVAKEKDQKAA